MTPAEGPIDIPATGEWIPFSTFKPGVGVQYLAEISGGARVSNQGDSIDGAYFMLSALKQVLPPDLAHVGLQFVSTGSARWMSSSLGAYKPRHFYVGLLTTDTAIPKFRIFDNQEPSVNKTPYTDNTGVLRVRLVQRTPVPETENDTLYFYNTAPGGSLSLLTRLSTFGTDSLRITSITLTDPKGSFTFSSSRGKTLSPTMVDSFALGEYEFDTLRVEFRPGFAGTFTGALSIVSANTLSQYRTRTVTLVGVSEISGVAVSNRDAGLEVWPNPVRSTLHVRMSQARKSDEILVCDPTGRVVKRASWTGESCDLDVRGLAKGRYTLSVGGQFHSAFWIE